MNKLKAKAIAAIDDLGDALLAGLKASCAAAAGTLGASGAGLVDTDWLGVLSTAGMSGVIFTLVRLGGASTDDNDPAPGQD